MDELPSLLAKCGDLPALKATISDLQIFLKMVHDEDGKFDLIKYWQQVSESCKVE